uniref:Uncharacterized protein n=1 Tax=Amphiprion percula TaxID=161767 RepID=A0A3P8RX50_AMPPE
LFTHPWIHTCITKHQCGLVCVLGRHCPLDEFQCNNTLCKPLAWKCDGEDDCGDNSDENPDECSECRVVSLTHLVCQSSSFVLMYFSLSVRLSGKFQCPPTRAFRCQNDRVCLQVSKRCDGVSNCGDNSDELNCRKLRNCCSIIWFVKSSIFSTLIKDKLTFICVCKCSRAYVLISKHTAGAYYISPPLIDKKAKLVHFNNEKAK